MASEGRLGLTLLNIELATPDKSIPLIKSGIIERPMLRERGYRLIRLAKVEGLFC